MCGIPPGLSGLLRIHLLRHAVLPEHRTVVCATHRPVLAVLLYPVLRRGPARKAARTMATRSLGGGVGLLHRRRRHARDEPADNDNTVFVARSVLHRGGCGLRPDGPGGLVCGYGRGSLGIIRDR